LLAETEESFAPLPVLRAPYRPAEPIGTIALREFADELYGSAEPAYDPFALPVEPDPLSIRSDGEGYVLSLALPLADRNDVDLARNAAEIVVTVGGHRRVLALPAALQRCHVAGAELRAGRLEVRFVPENAPQRTTA
jgi:arsenite-transporting ATPase